MIIFQRKENPFYCESGVPADCCQQTFFWFSFISNLGGKIKSRKTARMILDSVKEKEAEFEKRLTEVPGVGPSLAKAIKEAGFETIEQIMSASVKELAKVKGISKKKAESIIDFLNE